MQEAPVSSFTETERTHHHRHVYVSGSGELVFDDHETDLDHLRARATHDEPPLYRCRTYLRDLVPKAWIGKQGTLWLDRIISKDTGEQLGFAVYFQPDGEQSPIAARAASGD
jgi:hypothetical protein